MLTSTSYLNSYKGTDTKRMAASNNVEDFEYVTQFFGFTPKSFVDGVCNAINDYIRECFNEMGKILDGEFGKSDDISSSKIRKGCQELVAKCYRNVDSIIDKMELYMLNNIFVISPGVLLPEDQVHHKDDLNPSDSDANIDEEIMELKHSIKKELFVREKIQSERKKLGNVLEDLKRLEQWFDDVCGEISTKNLHDIINSVCSNSLEIKGILQTQKQVDM